MFGSFMPFGGRSKATSLSGAPDEGPMSKLGRGLGNAFGQARAPGQQPGFMPPGQERAMGPMGGFGQMIGGMFGGRMGQMGQPTPFNPNTGQPQMQPAIQNPPPMMGGAGPRTLEDFMRMINDPNNPKLMGGRQFNPTPSVQQLPQNPYAGAAPGDLSNYPGQIGDMYRQGKIQTFGGPRAMGPSFGMF